MKKPSDNVLRVNFGNCRSAPISEPRFRAGVTAASVAQVLDFPKRPAIDFSRISAADRHARGFFRAMSESGLVTVLTPETDLPGPQSCLESTEPLDGEVFRIPLAEFVDLLGSKGRIEDPGESVESALEALDALGVCVEFRQDEAYFEISHTSVNEGNLANFRPESHPVVGGTESGSFSYAEFSGWSLAEAFEMELFPDDFLDPSRASLLDLMLYVRDSLRLSGYEVPDDARLTLSKRQYVREGGVTIPVSLIPRAVSEAIVRVSPLMSNFSPEDRIERYFLSRVVPNIAPVE